MKLTRYILTASIAFGLQAQGVLNLITVGTFLHKDEMIYFNAVRFNKSIHQASSSISCRLESKEIKTISFTVYFYADEPSGKVLVLRLIKACEVIGIKAPNDENVEIRFKRRGEK